MSEILDTPLFGPGPILWIQELLGPGMAGAFRSIDLLATTWGVLLVAAVAFWVWGREDLYALAGIVAAEVVINLVLNQVFSVERPSPAEVRVYDEVPLGSFPSGHVFTATVLWGLLWARGRVPAIAAGLVVLGVGVSRLYLGAHYVGDVVAGAVLGTALVWAFTRVWPGLRGWLAGRDRSFFAMLGVGGAVLATLSAVVLESNHFAWNAAGIATGAAIALILEERRVGYDPTLAWPGDPMIRVLLGIVVIAPLVWIDRAAGGDALALGAATSFVATVWALWLAPALFSRTREAEAAA